MPEEETTPKSIGLRSNPGARPSAPPHRRPPKRPQLTAEDYVRGVLARDRVILGRAFTLLESARPAHRQQADQVLQALLPHAGGSYRIGISGPPGAGKSTFIERLGQSLLSQGRRVAVLAVDPSSEISGGSVLGDKTRMEELSRSDNAIVRPSPSGLHLGGVARRTRECVFLAEAAGFDVVLVETVGVGQSETQVSAMTDFFLLLAIAGAGDELQGIKRGILELVDLIAVNKADGGNEVPARRAKSQIEQALRLLRGSGEAWRPKALTCSAVTGAGMSKIWEQIEEHRRTLESDGRLEAKRAGQNLKWFRETVDLLLRERLRESAAAEFERLEGEVRENRLGPTAAAEQLVASVFPRSS